MDSEEKIVRHLEMIQAVIDRMAKNSFFIKGWAVTLAMIGSRFIDRDDDYFFIVFLVLLFFWVLDAYYLKEERAFRNLYEKICNQKETNFSMKRSEDTCHLKAFICACFSKTMIFYILPLILIFYAMDI